MYTAICNAILYCNFQNESLSLIIYITYFILKQSRHLTIFETKFLQIIILPQNVSVKNSFLTDGQPSLLVWERYYTWRFEPNSPPTHLALQQLKSNLLFDQFLQTNKIQMTLKIWYFQLFLFTKEYLNEIKYF